MPKITAKKARFFQLLGVELSIEKLDELAFDFGIEIEEDEINNSIIFEIAANRPDLLCVENLCYNLRLYLNLQEPRVYTFTQPKEKIFVKTNTKQIRPYIVGAILRNVQMDQESYESFIDIQDKLHHNLCRKRKLVAIGTHDLDKIKGPFYYDAQDPKQIIFQALKQSKETNAVDLFSILENDKQLKEYLPIIRDSTHYPVVFDSTQSVLSLPPIINSEYSKISPDTKNIFIESTCTDYQRAIASLGCLVSGFSMYCKNQFEIEMIEVIYEETGQIRITPEFQQRKLETNISYINKILGINIDQQRGVQLLQKMGISSKSDLNGNILVDVPFQRSDILQQCDIAEDIGIAYGYNNIVHKVPDVQTFGGETRLNKLSDMVREEVALAGFVECLNFVLCSVNDITKQLNRTETNQIVHISDSKSFEFECARSTLISAILKTLKSNATQKLPIQLFEVADVVIKGQRNENDGWVAGEGITGAINVRRLCAVVSDNASSGLDIVHGLLDQIMIKLNIPNEKQIGYHVQKHNDTTFFPGLQAQILYKNKPIGVMGVVHPVVLENFKWDYPASLIELDLEPLYKDFR